MCSRQLFICHYPWIVLTKVHTIPSIYSKGMYSSQNKMWDIKVVHKPFRTNSNTCMLKKPKDKIKKEAAREIVYKIQYKDCDCVYVGQSLCTLKTCIKEHGKVIATFDRNSLAKHHKLHNHQMNLKSVEIVGRLSAWRQRLILEVWRSMQDGSAISKHTVLPIIYSNIKSH